MQSEAARYKKEWQAAQKTLRASGEDCAFVYVHLQEDTGEPFYVGIGEVGTRPWSMGRSEFHANVCEKHGVRVEIIAEGLSWESACFWEQRWIKALRGAGYRLVNLTDGGEGTKGFIPSEETRQKYRKRSAGKNNPNYGVKCTAEKRAKISASLTGKPQRPDTEETKAKKKQAALKREEKLGPEYRSARMKKIHAAKTPEQKTFDAKKGWETRRRNKLLKEGAE